MAHANDVRGRRIYMMIGDGDGDGGSDADVTYVVM
jgi:hypothetical protein